MALSCYYHFPLFRPCWLQLFLSCTSRLYPLHVYLGAVFIPPVPESKCRFRLVVWKIVCSLENGGFSAFSSSLILPVLNQGQHPWEPKPKGVILGCCYSSLRNEEGKCTFLPLVQTLTEEEWVSRKSSGLGISVVPSIFFFLCFPTVLFFLWEVWLRFFCDEPPIKVFNTLESVTACMLCPCCSNFCVKTPVLLNWL